MDYNTAIEYFDNLTDTDKAKEQFAHFGRAVFYAQVLEQQIINMIVIHKQLAGQLINQKDIISLWDSYDLGTKTLGILVNELSHIYKVSEEDLTELRSLVKLRNYIVHDYFRFNDNLMLSGSGQRRTIGDFIEFCSRVKLLDTKLMEYAKTYNEKNGLTEHKIGLLIEEVKKEWEKKIISEDYETVIKK